MSEQLLKQMERWRNEEMREKMCGSKYQRYQRTKVLMIRPFGWWSIKPRTWTMKLKGWTILFQEPSFGCWCPEQFKTKCFLFDLFVCVQKFLFWTLSMATVLRLLFIPCPRHGAIDASMAIDCLSFVCQIYWMLIMTWKIFANSGYLLKNFSIMKIIKFLMMKKYWKIFLFKHKF